MSVNPSRAWTFGDITRGTGSSSRSVKEPLSATVLHPPRFCFFPKPKACFASQQSSFHGRKLQKLLSGNTNMEPLKIQMKASSVIDSWTW